MTSDRDREHAERTARIERLVREGAPFDRIFPTMGWGRPTPVPVPFADGSMEFASALRPSPHGGTPTRYFRLECQHGSGELYLLDVTRTESELVSWSGSVLGNMLPNHKARMVESGLLCLCWPKGWAAA